MEIPEAEQEKPDEPSIMELKEETKQVRYLSLFLDVLPLLPGKHKTLN